jgi:hypothetical protein
LSLARLVVSIVLGSLMLSLALYTLEPPFGVVLGVVVSGLLVGILVVKAGMAFAAGLVSGLSGFLLAYSLSGGGSIGFTVYRELLGSVGPVVPLAYFMLSCGAVSALMAIVLPAVGLRGRSDLRKPG